jgi:transposase
MRKLTLAKEAEIINIYKPSMSLRVVANLVGVSKTMVSRILKEKKIAVEKNFKAPKKKLSIKKEKRIFRKFLRREFSYAYDACKWVLENFQISISDQTIRRIIKRHGLKSLSKLKKPKLSIKHVKERIFFIKLTKKNDFVDWGKFIFSDESKFDLHGANGFRRI